MKTMTDTATFPDAAPLAGDGAFFRTLLSRMLAVLRLSGGIESLDAGLLAERIVLE